MGLVYLLSRSRTAAEELAQATDNRTCSWGQRRAVRVDLPDVEGRADWPVDICN